MKILKAQEGLFAITASKEELRILDQALNEVCNGLPLHDFENRLGAAHADVCRLLDQTSVALNAAKHH